MIWLGEEHGKLEKPQYKKDTLRKRNNLLSPLFISQ